jgi:RNA-binding protein
MKITSKERARLRAMANGMQPVFQIGKGGLTPVITDELDSVLEARELIKISVLETCAQDARELCETLSERLRAEPVQCIGRKFVIYRRSREGKHIELD